MLILSENWTLTGGRDLGDVVRWAREAEDAGFDAVMLSEHVVLGPDASDRGVMANPRDYAMPGNQDPSTPWPSSLVLHSAIAAATERVRLVASAVLAPLRHPLLLARDWGTLDLLSQGRLVIQPSVSWSKDEYAALGVPFHERGRILDEQLEILDLVWRESPASHHGEHFSFDDVTLEPKAWRPGGPRMWFGGQQAHGPVLRRLARYGHGFHPLGRAHRGGPGVRGRRHGAPPGARSRTSSWSAASARSSPTTTRARTSARRWTRSRPSGSRASPPSASSRRCSSTTSPSCPPSAATSYAAPRVSSEPGSAEDVPLGDLTMCRSDWVKQDTCSGPSPATSSASAPLNSG